MRLRQLVTYLLAKTVQLMIEHARSNLEIFPVSEGCALRSRPSKVPTILQGFLITLRRPIFGLTKVVVRILPPIRLSLILPSQLLNSALLAKRSRWFPSFMTAALRPIRLPILVA